MKATEKRARIENRGYKIENGYNPKTGRDYLRVSMRAVYEREFSNIHTAYRSIFG